MSDTSNIAEETEGVTPTDNPAPETPQSDNPAPEGDQGGEAPQEAPISLLTISDGERTVEVRVPTEVATAILEYKAPAVVYMADRGELDPGSPNDEFSRARQHMLNAVHELQNASLAHPVMTARGEVFGQAWQSAFTGTALVYNLLVQAGMAIRQQEELMAQMAAAQEQAAAAQQTVPGDAPASSLNHDPHGGTILG